MCLKISNYNIQYNYINRFYFMQPATQNVNVKGKSTNRKRSTRYCKRMLNDFFDVSFNPLPGEAHGERVTEIKWSGCRIYRVANVPNGIAKWGKTIVITCLVHHGCGKWIRRVFVQLLMRSRSRSWLRWLRKFVPEVLYLGDQFSRGESR